MDSKPVINIIWLKRNLRLQDNEPLYNAISHPNKSLILYSFEPFLLSDDHYSERHWDFIKQSLSNLNSKLRPYNTKVLSVKSELIQICNQIQEYYRIENIYSHQETGIRVTYERDKEFNRYCRNNSIVWTESVNNGVFRGLKDRTSWRKDWETYMKEPCFAFEPEENSFLDHSEISQLESVLPTMSLKTSGNSLFQKGGTTMAYRYLRSFFEERYQLYNTHISKPEQSRINCSRLSPYLSWGNLSVREVWQKAKETRRDSDHKRHLDAFTSRLRWQAHFIQKFEMEDTMEFESINKGYQKLKKNISEAYIKAWEEGMTGIPLVDACMRCLNTTGYLNFRMRALVVSFATHHLWQPWQAISRHLSRMFLDFEPGIHFPQLQMQAGETGINQIRIYNPVKNSMEHDPNGQYILKWVPELRKIPVEFVHEPYLMTELEQKFFNFHLGVDYPKPIVNIGNSRKTASASLWKLRSDELVKAENRRILQKHTLPRRKVYD